MGVQENVYVSMCNHERENLERSLYCADRRQTNWMEINRKTRIMIGWNEEMGKVWANLVLANSMIFVCVENVITLLANQNGNCSTFFALQINIPTLLSKKKCST